MVKRPASAPPLALALASALALAAHAAPQQAPEANWPRFRGPLGTGHLPGPLGGIRWDKGDIRWRAQLPAPGHSSPVTWGERIFLTGALDSGKTRAVFCIDANSGKVLWQQPVACAAPEKINKLNGFATPSCATDGQRVVAFFGPAGIHCFDLDGNKIWSRDLGPFPGPFGVSASPIIDGERVIQNSDREGTGHLVALDRTTGKTLWQTARVDLPKGGWSTPILIRTPARRELVLNGEFGLWSYDPDSGKELWFCKGFNGRGEPMPEFARDLLLVVNGKPGDVYAVRPGGRGDVTASHMAWHTPRRKGRDCPSPAVVGDLMFVVGMTGIAALYDIRDGTQRWEGRLEGAFSSSPIVSDADGLMLLHNDAGSTYVLRPGTTLEIVARNPIDPATPELFRASLAPLGHDLLFRSESALYRITPRG